VGRVEDFLNVGTVFLGIGNLFGLIVVENSWDFNHRD